jgi:hypothetical protein
MPTSSAENFQKEGFCPFFSFFLFFFCPLFKTFFFKQARTNAVLCKECAVNKNNCILCGAYFDTLDVGALPAALCRRHATKESFHAKCAKMKK